MSTKLFFTYWDSLPANIGFKQFGSAHFLWLLGIAVAITVLLYMYCHSNNKIQVRIDRLTGWTLVCLILVGACYLIIIDKQTVYELPLHLCSMAAFLCLIHVYSKWDWVSQSIYSLCLPGTLFALFFPDWIIYPAVHFITIEGFCFHGGIVFYIICQLRTGKIVPNLKKLWKAFFFLAIAAFGVWIFDHVFDANYMFLNWPPEGSPLDWIAGFMGNPGYLIGYAALVIIIPVIMDVLYDFLISKRMDFESHRKTAVRKKD